MDRGIHAIILTLNEEQHLARCITSIREQCSDITVVDSGSTDATLVIAKSLGANVLSNAWVNYATQMNFAIDQLENRGGWLLRIDADEVLDTDSRQTLIEAVAAAAPDVDALLVQRRIHFLGRRIRHGAIEPSWQLRLWRNGSGRCEQRWMDEHIQVAGRVVNSELVISDINLNSLSWWTAKHNSYASREAIDVLNRRHSFLKQAELGSGGISPQARMRRFMKERVYGLAPSGLRALLYFLYRFVFRLGFLDGTPGYYFHLMQALWYRTLVDAKVHEIEAHAKAHGVPIVEAIRERTGLSVGTKTS
jgi:glycosyltransferase involved in cell wall biosynthesis